jgi:hypothetical protein
MESSYILFLKIIVFLEVVIIVFLEIVIIVSRSSMPRYP